MRQWCGRTAAVAARLVQAVEKLPPPSPPPLPPKVGKRRGGKNGGGDGGDGDDGNKKVEVPEQRCQLRSEKVMPLEKAGFYSQAAGYCATLYAWHAPPCALQQRRLA